MLNKIRPHKVIIFFWLDMVYDFISELIATLASFNIQVIFSSITFYIVNLTLSWEGNGWNPGRSSCSP